MNHPVVSVVMPVYNGEQYLTEAIKSILDQTFRDFEFIIINDGSTDSSEKIILSFQDNRIRYVRNESNLKIIDTLNNGFDLAKGTYIARMDADDVAFPERLSKQLAFMEANPEYGLCGTDIELIGNTDAKSWVRTGDNEYLKFALLFYNPFCHPTVLIRTSVLRKHKLYYNKKYVHVEDYELWARFSKHAQIGNLEEKLLKYRMHEGQISVKYKELQDEMLDRVKLDLYNSMVQFPFRKEKETHLFLVNNCYSSKATDYNEIVHNFKKYNFFDLQENRKRVDRWVNSIRKSVPYKKQWNNKFLLDWVAEVKKASTRI